MTETMPSVPSSCAKKLLKHFRASDSMALASDSLWMSRTYFLLNRKDAVETAGFFTSEAAGKIISTASTEVMLLSGSSKVSFLLTTRQWLTIFYGCQRGAEKSGSVHKSLTNPVLMDILAASTLWWSNHLKIHRGAGAASSSCAHWSFGAWSCYW